MRVDSLVALETDQMTVIDLGKRFSEFGLADADLTLQQEWAAKFESDKQGSRKATVSQIPSTLQRVG
jgi:hypothetical protein